MRNKNVQTAQIEKVVEAVIRARRSVRRFGDRPISEEQIKTILEAGVYAPSGSNWQNQRFLVVTDSEEISRIGKTRFVWPYRNLDVDKIRNSNPAGIIGHCTLLVIVFADAMENDRRGHGEYHLWESLECQNCAASIQNMLIQATAMGIGSCWISASDGMSYTRLLSGQSWRSLLSNYEIPETLKLHGIVAFGYPLKTTSEGFPMGESKHGATIWQSTNRKPLNEYLVGLRKQNESGYSRRSRLVPLYAFCIRQLLKIVHRLDIAIHRKEVGN